MEIVPSVFDRISVRVIAVQRGHSGPKVLFPRYISKTITKTKTSLISNLNVGVIDFIKLPLFSQSLFLGVTRLCHPLISHPALKM